MRVLRVLLWSLLPAALLVAAVWYLGRPRPVAVQVAEVARGPVALTVSNTRAGTVKACRRARLSPAMGGQIARLTVREGQPVAAGTLLLELWNEDLRAELAHAEREAAASRARRDATCLRAEVAEREADRLARLRHSGAVSAEALDKARTSARAARAECRAAEAAWQVSRSRVAIARARLERTRLYAPFDGVVAEVNGELAEYVTPSPVGVATPPAIDLIDNRCYYVLAPIDEVDAPRVRVGLPVRIGLDAFPDRHFQGRVRRITDYVQARARQARTVDVEVAFTDPADYRDLLPGYSADVDVIVATHADTLRLPTEAVVESRWVYVFHPDTGRLEKRSFTPGLSNWDWTEVRDGLRAGEQVVTTVDRDGVRDGALANVEAEER